MIRYSDRLGRSGVPADPLLAAAVMAIVGDVLGHGIDDRRADRSFADLGLGSLLAVRLIDRINRGFGLTLGIETLFECPTPATLVARLAGLGVAVVRALLGFQHEAAAPVEVDAADADGAVPVGEADGLFEDVGVLGVVRAGGLGRFDLQHGAQFREEKLVVGAF